MPTFDLLETERRTTELHRHASYTLYLTLHKTASRPFYSAFILTREDRTSEIWGPYYRYPLSDRGLWESISEFLGA